MHAMRACGRGVGFTAHFKYRVTPRAGLEPATLRLTAECSTIELSRISTKGGPTKWGDSLVRYERPRAKHAFHGASFPFHTQPTGVAQQACTFGKLLPRKPNTERNKPRFTDPKESTTLRVVPLRAKDKPSAY